MPDSPDTCLALRELAELLDGAELRYTHSPESGVLRVSFASDHYVDDSGNKRISIFLSVHPEEQLIVADIPWAYRLEHARDKHAARKALLYVNYAMKAVHLGVDPGDRDEVCARAELWLKGITPSSDWIRAALNRLAGQFDLSARLLQPVWRGGRRELRKLVERGMQPQPSGAGQCRQGPSRAVS